MTLSEKEKKELRGKAHKLSPIVSIGQKGLTENIHLEIERALIDHELLKIKIVTGEREEKKQFIETICHRHQAELIQAVGHVATIYRPEE